MTGQDYAAAPGRTDRRKQVGLAGGGVPAQRARDAEAAQVVGDPLDQRQIGAGRGGIEGDEPLEDTERRRE
jgi:hypothetical protein